MKAATTAGASLFGSFCFVRAMERANVNRVVRQLPRRTGGLTREKRIMPVIRKKNKTTADKMWHIIKWVCTYRKKTFIVLHGKNDFVKVSKNLARYGSENNFVGPSK